jgi:hypothetical protein
VYQAVIATKLLYGIEALYPCTSTVEKLNAFQLKGFRKMLKIQTTLMTGITRMVSYTKNVMKSSESRKWGPRERSNL